MNNNDQIITVATEMLQSRGYSVSHHEDGVYLATKSDEEPIYLYLLNTCLNKAVIVHYIGVFITKKIKHAIIVYRDTITPSVKKTLKTVVTTRIELFNDKELRFNITKHVLVPPHYRVDPTLHPEREKYPTILKSDPIVRFYGFKVGDVVKIIRPLGLYYRVVRAKVD